MQTLTPDDVQAAIDKLLPGTKIRFFEESTETSQLAADAVGCEVGQIAKSICFMINKEMPVLVVTSGDQTVDDRKIAGLFEVGRKKVRLAKPDQCIEIFGYAPGGVPPLGHRADNIVVYLDEMLRRYEDIYAAGGTANTIFPLTPDSLQQATGGTYADVVKSES